MDWLDDGFVIARHKHGESSLIVKLLTESHGLHAGLVRGGAGTRSRAVYQVGNRVRAAWRARLSDHLGNFTCELGEAHAAALLDERLPLAALGAAAALVEASLPEREPNSEVFESFSGLLRSLRGPGWAGAYARFELGLLGALGFGLDLDRCAATGAREGLAFVSPRTGRAVSEAAAGPYRSRLLPLPPFLIAPVGAEAPPLSAVVDALRLTEYFFERQVLEPAGRRMPSGRRLLFDGIVSQTTRSSRTHVPEAQ